MEPSNAVGPGAVQQDLIAPAPLLDNATDNDVITILNPLPFDFKGQVGITRPVNEPFSVRQTPNMPSSIRNESQLNNALGAPLKNPEHVGRRHAINIIEIPAGQSRRVQGSAAKVIVEQLVTAILQSRKLNLWLADRAKRNEVEVEIILGRSSVSEFYDVVDQNSQVQKALDKANGASDGSETEFPGLSSRETTEVTSVPSGSVAADNPTEEKRRPGRPAKT